MTQSEWYSTDELSALVKALPFEAITQRKTRLYTCACLRATWDRLKDQRLKDAVLVAEWWSNSGLGDCPVNFFSATPLLGPIVTAEAAMNLAYLHVREVPQTEYVDEGLIRELCSLITTPHDSPWRNSVEANNLQNALQLYLVLGRKTTADIFREIFANPDRPIYVGKQGLAATTPARSIDYGSWKDWNDGAIPKMAQAILTHGSFEELSILADALEEAGLSGECCIHCKGKGFHRTGYVMCDMEGIHDTREDLVCFGCNGTGREAHPLVTHLRSKGPHYRGCWALDLLLGKSE